MHLNAAFTFDRYVPAPRATALATCRAIAAGPWPPRGCLFLCGPPGVGKTHLLHAIGHAARERHRDARIYAVTAGELRDQLIQAMRRDTLSELRDKYERAELLLLDDLHVLAGLEATRQAITHLLPLRSGGCLVCASADDVPGFHEFVAHVSSPCDARFLLLGRPSQTHMTRIVRRTAADRGVRLPARAADRIARQARGDVRRAMAAVADRDLRRRVTARASISYSSR